MGESLLLITIITLVVLTIRRARPVVLENPVIIQRPGQYHITLAPQLNRAQNFIEQVARRYAEINPKGGDIAGAYFMVRDPQVVPPGSNYYLLAVAVRGGTLYFHAVNPRSLPENDKSEHQNLQDFFTAALPVSPAAAGEELQGGQRMGDAVAEVAGAMNIAVQPLQES